MLILFQYRCGGKKCLTAIEVSAQTLTPTIFSEEFCENSAQVMIHKNCKLQL